MFANSRPPVTPYASVVIPTHDRASTLATTVLSVQRQTVRDIEILVCGDGASTEVAAVATGIAAQDARVRFLAFAKAAGTGGANRDRAIRDFARAERIFYSDDDDLWLPAHVETLGPQLDRHDVADSLPASLSLGGRLALACVNGGNPLTRMLLAQGKLKMTYDTHLAHRRSSYLALGAPWNAGARGEAVRRMLGSFAQAEAVTWKTLPLATALSLHGGARSFLSPVQRQAENAEWAKRVAALSPVALTACADPVWHFFTCLNRFKPEAGDSLADYLARLGMTLGEDEDNGPLRLPLDTAKQQEMDIVLRIQAGRPVAAAEVGRIAPFLLDTVASAIVPWAWLRRAVKGLPPPEVDKALAPLPGEDRRTAELRALFGVYRLLWARKVDKALALAQSLATEVVEVPQEAEILLAEVLIRRGDLEAGVSWMKRAAGREDRPSGLAMRYVMALLDAGRLDEAENHLQYVEGRFGGLPFAIALRQRLSGLTAARAGLAP